MTEILIFSPLFAIGIGIICIIGRIMISILKLEDKSPEAHVDYGIFAIYILTIGYIIYSLV